MSKKKIKSRRKLSREELFPNKVKKEEDLQLWIMDKLIEDAIPDKEERREYIHSLLDGMDTEPDLEIK